MGMVMEAFHHGNPLPISFNNLLPVPPEGTSNLGLLSLKRPGPEGNLNLTISPLQSLIAEKGAPILNRILLSLLLVRGVVFGALGVLVTN